ncbi:MAG: phage scaffolding protein [Ruminococcus sp.]|nr:phage scaffolding protein [Ruminococcus sp.]
MKKEELTALGLTEEQAGKILELHTAEQQEAAARLSEAEAKLTAAEKNAAEMTEKVKAFDGVDVETLKKSAAEWEQKYNADLNAARVDNAVSLALTKAGAKDVELAKHLIDTSLVKLDGGNVMGLSEQLEKIKSEKSFLFGEDEKPVATVSTGADHNHTTAGFGDSEIRAVMGLSPAAGK